MTKKKFFKKDLIFYIALLALPVLQFCIFYIGVNGRSFLYSFQNITIQGKDQIVTWSISSLAQAFQELFSVNYKIYLRNSLITYVCTYFIGTTLALFFSYFIYKKLPMNGLFKVFLFIPSVISAIVLCVIFKTFVLDVVPGVSKDLFGIKITGLLEDGSSVIFPTLIFYNIFVSFGTSVLMYSNAMSNIAPEVIEAGVIDGASPIKELFLIVIPSIFPTISSFAITSIAAIFVNQLSCFAFWGTLAPTEVRTIGYDLYIRTVGASVTDYPVLSGIGFLLTLVAVPLTFLVKYLLERFGPSEK